MIKKNPLESIVTSEIDYGFLKNTLKDYKFPRNKVASLIKGGELISVKKGLYVRKNSDYSLPVLANMIYGPSYVSEDYALAWFLFLNAFTKLQV
jgi:hypothetical protein